MRQPKIATPQLVAAPQILERRVALAILVPGTLVVEHPAVVRPAVVRLAAVLLAAVLLAEVRQEVVLLVVEPRDRFQMILSRAGRRVARNGFPTM